MSIVYDKVREFKKNYPSTVTWWRLKKHAAIIDKHLNPGEKVLYVFAGQLNNRSIDLCETSVLALTSERLMIGQKKITPGYRFSSVTPNLYNDMKVTSGLIWGRIIIDTVKEVVRVSNLSKSSLTEIETNISSYMLKKKKLYKEEKE